MARRALAVLCACAVLAACEGVEVKEDAPPTSHPGKYDRDNQPGSSSRDTVFGLGGLFTGTKQMPDDGSGGGVGVNSFLWRASLDTVAFMPLSSADPFGGVIITEWYAPPQTPDERFKVTVYILSRQLRSDAVKVAVFKKRRNGETDWIDSPVDKKTAADLENAILSRARELRVASVGDG